MLTYFIYEVQSIKNNILISDCTLNCQITSIFKLTDVDILNGIDTQVEDLTVKSYKLCSFLHQAQMHYLTVYTL